MARAVQDMSMRMDDKRHKIHRWLSAPDVFSNHYKAQEKRQPNTGAWFITSPQYGAWKTNPDSFLWLHGIPGCGKTILASAVIDDVHYHCHHDHTRAVVFFYFDFNDIRKQGHEGMIRSLLMQLSGHSANTPRALESLFSSCMNGERQPRTGALLLALRQMVEEFNEVFIIIDALDECRQREELLEIIEEVAGWRIGKLHMLTTSRKEIDIKESFDPLINCQGIDIQRSIVKDIRDYVQQRLQSDIRLRRWCENPQVLREIETILVGKADGRFGWVECQLNALRDCFTSEMLREALKSLPVGLDETYTRALCKIAPEYRHDAWKILQWLAFSAQPLQIEEIAEVIAIDLEDGHQFSPENRLKDPRDILTICSSLVTTTASTVEGPHGEITKTEVRLAHFSVREYLGSERIRHGPACQYSIGEMSANAFIAKTCLAYLLQFDRPNSLTSQIIKKFPLAKYAAKYWIQHTRTAGQDAHTILPLIMELFEKTDAYVNWIRLFDLDHPWEEPDITKSLESAAPPLYYASLAGLLEVVKQLLDMRADVNAPGGEYGTALQVASFQGHGQTVELLLDHGAQADAQGGKYGNALQAASFGGHIQIVQQLLFTGANVNAQGGKYGNALQAALASDSVYEQIIQQLLDAGADVNAQGGEYGNALQAALASDSIHEQIIQQLLDAGADVHAQGGEYGNALQAALFRGHDQIVQQLLERGADINAEGGKYGKALQAASAGGHEQIVRRLLDNGAGVDGSTNHGQTALHWAAGNGHEAVVWLLMERGANVDASTSHGQTALHWAARSGHEAVVRLLINNGANLDTKDDGQKTALARADEGGHKGTVQLLIANGALVAGPPIAPKADSGEESSETPSGDFESVIVNFYLKEKEQHRVLTPSVHELVYSPGPKAAMSRGQPHDISPDFRWLHLPANNMMWVQDLITKISKERSGVFEGGIWPDQEHHGPTIHARFFKPYMKMGPNDSDRKWLVLFVCVIFTLLRKYTGPLLTDPSMPYIHWETNEALGRMKKTLTRVAKTPISDMASISQTEALEADEKLLWSYLYKSPPLHIRRTLNQFYYYTLESTDVRDENQFVSRYFKDKFKGGEEPVLMVDQLWLWVLDDQTVITSFPRRWSSRSNGDPDHKDKSDVLKSILQHLQNSERAPIKTTFDLAALIVKKCAGICLNQTENPNEKLQFLEFFEDSIICKENDESILFSKFVEAAKKLRNDSDEEDKMSQYHEDLEALYDITKEGAILREIKVIVDELKIISMVVQEQNEALGLAPQINSRPFLELFTMVVRHKKQIDKMNERADNLYKAFKYLLNLKQKQANVSESRFARQLTEKTQSQLDEARKQGNTIMVFTIVTIIFLPLSYMAAFFTIPIAEFPKDQNGLHLSYVSKYMFPISASITVPLVILALNVNEMGKRYKEIWGWIRRFRFDPHEKLNQWMIKWHDREEHKRSLLITSTMISERNVQTQIRKRVVDVELGEGRRRPTFRGNTW